MPLGVPLSREQAHGQRRSADYANSLVLQVRHELKQGFVVEAIVTVGQNHVHSSFRSSVQHISAQERFICVREVPT